MSLTGNFDRREKGKIQNSLDSEIQSNTKNESFVKAGRVRNLFFVQPDGRQQFLNYNYLVSGEYLPAENLIKLLYTSDEINISGRNLEPLFVKISMQVLRKVVAIDKRHADTHEPEDTVVTSIKIVSNK